MKIDSHSLQSQACLPQALYTWSPILQTPHKAPLKGNEEFLGLCFPCCPVTFFGAFSDTQKGPDKRCRWTANVALLVPSFLCICGFPSLLVHTRQSNVPNCTPGTQGLTTPLIFNTNYNSGCQQNRSHCKQPRNPSILNSARAFRCYLSCRKEELQALTLLQ